MRNQTRLAMSKKQRLLPEERDLLKRICATLPTIPRTNKDGDIIWVMDKAFGLYIYQNYDALIKEGRVLLPRQEYNKTKLHNKKLDIPRADTIDTWERMKKAHFGGYIESEVIKHREEAERFYKRQSELKEKHNTESVKENS